MANTLLLTQDIWDLCLDASGNIAMAQPPYALAQDAASSIRTFAGEVYYDTTRGVPYFAQILGQLPPVSLMKQQFTDAALLVPGVASAQTFITGFSGRKISGQAQITTTSGVTMGVSLSSSGNQGRFILDQSSLDQTALG